jgi:two-component system nitrate/nitrite response regulator NarL
MAKKSVLIVDDSPFVRNALRGMFLPVSDFEVSGEAENGQDAIDKAELLWPDLIILDLTMPVMNGLHAAPLLAKMLPDVRIILFTAHNGPQVERLAQRAGIHAVIDKNRAFEMLIPKARMLLVA